MEDSVHIEGGMPAELAEAERRLVEALDRLEGAVERSAAPRPEPADPAEVERLEAELEAERDAAAQLDDRVRALKRRQTTHVAKLEAELADLRARLEDHEREARQLRGVNQRLRENCGALRDAMAEGLAEPDLVNRATAAELEALRLQRQADRDDLDRLIEEVSPIMAMPEEA
ncbi:hypothetical protein [Hasllibacter halocynthiae]|nr:hypothetical protein [Hasllibacter halocynthiae]